MGSAVEIASPVAGAIAQEGRTMSTTPGEFMRDDEELSAVLFRKRHPGCPLDVGKRTMSRSSDYYEAVVT